MQQSAHPEELNVDDVLEQYKDMIEMMAWQFWKKLPSHVKSWVGRDDFVAEARLVLVQMAQRGQFQSERASLSTFVWMTVSHMFCNIFKAHRTNKRHAELTLNLDELGPVDLEKILMEEASFTFIEDKDAFEYMRGMASPELRGMMERWFRFGGVPRSNGRRKLYREFEVLAKQSGVTRNDCARMFGSGICAD